MPGSLAVLFTGPEFASLSGVVNYLLKTPSVLPTKLVQWVPAQNVSFSDADFLGITPSFSDAVRDAFAEKGIYEDPTDVLERDPVMVEHLPKLRVNRAGKNSSLRKNDVIQPLSKTTCANGDAAMICIDSNGNKITVPMCSDMRVSPVAPRSIARKPSLTPPSLPMRPVFMQTDRSVEGHDKQAKKGYERFFPTLLEQKPTVSAAGKDGKAKPGVRQKDPKQRPRTGTSVTKGEQAPIYREVLKEGWLEKLPPRGNAIQGWKARWFKLVISISDISTEVGPVILEYYEKESSSKAKGVIYLAEADRICGVEHDDKSKTPLKKVSDDVLLKIVTPDRTYPLKAKSSFEREAWLKTLNDTLGLNVTGSPRRRQKPSLSSDSKEGEFEVKCLGENLSLQSGILSVRERTVSVYRKPHIIPI